jgi:TetR/AcrR family fatty acid metabolism transcriptional regulator
MTDTIREDTRTKRQAILDAARNLFAKQGYENTTIANIAKEAGVAVGTAYLYFRNKHEIYTSASLDWLATIAVALESPEILTMPIEQVPRVMIEAAFRICHEKNELMSLFQVDIQTKEEMWQHKAAEGRIANALQNFFLQAIAQGQIPPFDTEMYARLLFGLVHSALQDCFVIESGGREDLYRERTIEIVERLFFGPSIREGKK